MRVPVWVIGVFGTLFVVIGAMVGTVISFRKPTSCWQRRAAVGPRLAGRCRILTP